MWGSILRGYSHGLDPNIIKVDDHPLIVVIAIWDILAESWEYIDYPFSEKAFKIYLKTSLKNKRHIIRCKMDLLKIFKILIILLV